MLQWWVRSGLGVWHFLQKRALPLDETVMDSKSEGKAWPLDSDVGSIEYFPPSLSDLLLPDVLRGEPGSVKTAVVYEAFSRRYNTTPNIEEAFIGRPMSLAPVSPRPVVYSTHAAHVVREYTNASGK